MAPAPSAALSNAEPVPWQDNGQIVRLYRHLNGQEVFWCGGTKIDDYWVLTAAHCVSDQENIYGCSGPSPDKVGQADCYTSADRAMALYLGWHTLSTSEITVRTASGKTRQPAQLDVYPGYTQVVSAGNPVFRWLPCAWKCALINWSLAFVTGDVALIRLKSPETEIGTSRLASSSALITAKRAVRAFGWGDTDPTGAFSLSSSLRRSPAGAFELTSPPTLPDCDSDASPYVNQVPADTVICIRSTDGVHGVGGGDSGGPLYATDTEGEQTQIGVTSYGPSIGYATTANPNKYASVPRMIKWIRSKTGIGETAGSGSDNVATSLVIDNSGSMGWNDPQALRREAAKSYVKTAIDGDYAGIVGFEDSAYQIASIGRIPDSRQGLLQALETGIFAGGGTNIGAGLTAACSMLADSGLPQKRAAILLTDGEGGYGGESSCFSSKGWRVFTVGLGSGVNTTLLKQIATDTGGTYQPVPTPVRLQCEFQKVRAAIAGGSTPPCLVDLIEAGQTLLKKILVGARTARIVFSTQWPGSRVETTLVSPSGREIDATTSSWDVSHEAGPTQETFVVSLPEPGEWTVKLYGAEIDPGGEEVVLGSSPVPFSNELPTVDPEMSRDHGPGPLTVSFLANAEDPDGSIDRIFWDFGDGFMAQGPAVSHTYAKAGTFTPKVTAIDDEGEPVSKQLGQVTVEGSPPVADFSYEVEGRTVSVDASESADADGGIVIYGWDFDGDGGLDKSSSSPASSWTFPAGGEKRITLGIESDDGEVASATQVVTIAADPPPAPRGPETTAVTPEPNNALAARGVKVKKRKALVTLTCPNGVPCGGVLQLSGRTPPSRKLTKIGRVSFSVPGGRTAVLRVPVPGAWLRRLRAAPSGRLKARVGGRGVVAGAVILRLAS